MYSDWVQALDGAFDVSGSGMERKVTEQYGSPAVLGLIVHSHPLRPPPLPVMPTFLPYTFFSGLHLQAN